MNRSAVFATKPLEVARRAVHGWCGSAIDLIFPPSCAVCQRQLEDSRGGLICEHCRPELVDARPYCRRCGLLTHAASGSLDCVQCRDVRQHFQSVVRLGEYRGTLRRSVLRTKRAHGRPLAMTLAELLADAGGDFWRETAVDAVVPVPMHWTRLLLRGSNGPTILAERLARHLGMPLAAHLLKRTRRTAPQASLPVTRRRANVRGAFKAVEHRDLPGARLLLVDDVLTTGATLNEAARVLKLAGAASISVAVLARTQDPASA